MPWCCPALPLIPCTTIPHPDPLHYPLQVYITSRSAAACEKTAQKLTQTGPGECVALAQDLSSAAGVQAFADALAARESKLDILVNNSGIAWGRDFDSFEEEVGGSLISCR